MIFFREKKFSYLLKAPSGKRGFFFWLQAGFEKGIDPVSGMTVSLPEVDAWLTEAATLFAEGPAPVEALLFLIRNHLAERAEKSGAKLAVLTLREERNWALTWKAGQGESLLHRTFHYEEITHEDRADLWRIEMGWRRSPRDDFDYFHESLQVLKALPRGHKKRPERILCPTSFLAEMSIESLREGWTLEL